MVFVGLKSWLFEFGFNVVEQYQEEAYERRLKSIRDVLSFVLNPLRHEHFENLAIYFR